MNLPAHIEAKLIKIARERGYSELTFLSIRERFINLVNISEKIVRQRVKNKMKKVV